MHQEAGSNCIRATMHKETRITPRAVDLTQPQWGPVIYHHTHDACEAPPWQVLANAPLLPSLGKPLQLFQKALTSCLLASVASFYPSEGRLSSERCNQSLPSAHTPPWGCIG